MIEVITAPTLAPAMMSDSKINVFLAGGITNCLVWQDEVIEHLQRLDAQKMKSSPAIRVFNPRRQNFPIGDPGAAMEQIKWEYDVLSNPRLDIFSMYFCAGPSDQPICMYELGRYSVMFKNRFDVDDIRSRVIVSVEEGYKRAQDVFIQLGLDPVLSQSNINADSTPKDHARRIYESACKIHMIQNLRALPVTNDNDLATLDSFYHKFESLYWQYDDLKE